MATPSGEIYLLSNVPINSSYEHSFDFDSKEQQWSYWSKYIEHTLLHYTYIRKEREWINVELPMAKLDNVNYMIFRSESDSRLYFAFVTNKAYSNPNTTTIFYELDVFQTYMFDYKWKASYIQQAHVDRWTAEHKPIYSKTDEGLDYGSEYSVESAYRLSDNTGVKWAVATLTSFSGLIEEGNVLENSTLMPCPSPFISLLIPIDVNADFTSDSGVSLTTHTISIGGEIISGTGTYSTFVKYMLGSDRDSKDDEATTGAIGNFIQSITLLPYNPFVTVSDGDFINFDFPVNAFSTVTIGDKTYVQVKNLKLLPGLLAVADWDIGLTDSLPTEEEWESIKANPRTTKTDKRYESKLLCGPYRYNILTDWRNSPVIFKNEYMTTDKIEIRYSYGLSHNIPFRYWVKDYKKDPEGRYTSLTQPIGLEFPIISDKYATYMLENKNTIQANVTNSIISGATNVLQSGMSGGGPLGMLMSGIGSAVNTANMIRSENAKQADIKNLPDTVINSVDSSFNIVDNNTEVCWYRMRICCENEAILAGIFNMTGYKVHSIDVPNTRSRVRFNYLQTRGANIVGSFNQNDLKKLKSIFDNGITIWHYSDKDFNPFDYGYENIEVNLL